MNEKRPQQPSTPKWQRPRFDDWATTVFERKVANGALRSVRGRDNWESVLRVHLSPSFGGYFVDRIYPRGHRAVVRVPCVRGTHERDGLM